MMSNDHLSTRDLFHVQHAVTGVFITNKCNFICDHCCTDSTPQAKNILTAQSARLLVSQISKLASTRVIHISGGEPFMNLSALIAIFEEARDRKIRVAINTNGFWINNLRIRRILEVNSDIITDIFISYSKWHQSFLDMNSYKNCISFASKHIKFVEAMIVGKDQQDTQQLVRNLWPDVLPSGVFISHDIVARYGRASNFDHSEFTSDNLRRGRCTLTNRITIMDDGSVLMCCNTVNFSNGSSGLCFGNVFETDFDEIVGKIVDSKLYNFISVFGPHTAYKSSKNAIYDNLDNIDNLDMCEVCRKIV